MITAIILRSIAPHALIELAPYLNDAMEQYEINTLQRQAMFLAQTAHESDGFQTTQEYGSGKIYEGRQDLGNDHAGDGMKYKGRGLLQITGRFNYQKVGEALGVDFVNTPELLQLPGWACKSAGWFWAVHKLNELADKGRFTDITKVINGGQNGAASRHDYYNKALAALSKA